MTAFKLRRFAMMAACLLLTAGCSNGHAPGADGNADLGVTAAPPVNGTSGSGVLYVPGPYSLQGTVFDAYAGPLAAEINVFVTLSGETRSSWFRVPTDSAGRFTVTRLPESRVRLSASPMRDYVQPCGATVDLHGDVTLDLEIVSLATLNSLDPPRPLTAHGPTFVGTVFEMTAAGKQPLAGAFIDVSDDGLTSQATTQTDFNGHYFLCDLPQPSVGLSVYKDNYVTEVWPVDTTQSATLDIEFKRLDTVF